MRPRHTLLLLALAAFPVLLALLLVGNGSLSAPSGAAPVLPAGGRLARVKLQLLGSSGRVPANQCGAVRHYYAYPSQGHVSYRGTIVPPGEWKLTVKLKACYAGSFQSAGDSVATVHASGSFTGSFPVPIAGYYDARAELSRGGQPVSRSAKVFFEVR
ncbi:MAG TPA: hypothetical protein VFP55_07085 [Solirubrobacteraceae bacterium]|nr:hypothetical protein [Solirubrobacteraceae bacterium]